MTGEALLFYDGECRLCLRAMDLVRAWDRTGRVVCLPYQHPFTARILPDVSRQELSRAILLVGPRGRRYQGADALPRLLSLLPGGAPLRLCFEIPGVAALARRIYRLVADHRHELGCSLRTRGAPA
ncbi:MAG: thiol-disulfide oxidoreductase DCC family protein [Gemmatimonadota bacterium]